MTSCSGPGMHCSRYLGSIRPRDALTSCQEAGKRAGHHLAREQRTPSHVLQKLSLASFLAGRPEHFEV